MTTGDDPRLIEDYIPIEAISKEARREKSIRKGHISTLHLWWARRPLVAARAAVYGALVPAPEDVEGQKQAARFVTRLCKYPGAKSTIAEAQEHILQAHAERLSAEQGERVTAEDIQAGRAPRPRVLDMFAGGGAIPLEALRLGCEAYAADLNPVAHLIELCTLVYPQQYGAPNPAAVGSAPDGSWAGLAAEVEHWGRWVLERVRAEIGDLYPPVPSAALRTGPAPRHSERSEESPTTAEQLPLDLAAKQTQEGYDARAGMLTPVAYLWTRTVRCKNPACGGTVPLARQTWLAKKKGRYIALRPDAEANRDKPPGGKRVRYQVVEATTQRGLGFNPSAGSRRGNVPCPFCGTVADSDYVKTEGQAGRMEVQPMAVVAVKANKREKVYLAAEDVPSSMWPDDEAIHERIQEIGDKDAGQYPPPLSVPNEPIEGKLADQVPFYGMREFKDLFLPRQLLTLLAFVGGVRRVYQLMLERGIEQERAKATVAYLGFAVDKLALRSNTLCTWATTSAGGRLTQAFGRQALEMVWDFAEANAFSEASGSFLLALRDTAVHATILGTLDKPAKVSRGSAASLDYDSGFFDAIVTDPPYYDNIFYADLSDFFFVWLKRSIGYAFPSHFSALLAPKKREIVASPWRHDSNAEAAEFYEGLLMESLAQAWRVLKPDSPLIIVYAHKTTAGWATLVDAMRFAGFVVTEAWPIHTELTGHRKAETASLASSIFLVARRREEDGTGSYELQVRPELQRIVRERVERLWAQGVTGADLVIACVGAGLRAFTGYARVEYANGEPVPADSFLAEVEGVVLETLLEKLFGVSQAGVSRVDRFTRFYVLWRYAYRQGTIDAGEAIVFAYPQGVELDGPGGLTSGGNPLVEKARGKYRLRDFTERGEDEDLGLPADRGLPSPADRLRSVSGGGVGGGSVPSLIDVLHRLLWLVEHSPAAIPAFLDQVRPDVERLRVVAQTLAGQTLAGQTPTGNGGNGGRSLVAARGAEAAALRKLTTNWRTLIEAHRGALV